MPDSQLTTGQEELRLPNLAGSSDLIKLLANLTIMSDVQSKVSEHITAPFEIPTPKEKVKRRPDGYDYIENTWIDKSFKTHSPLYTTDLVHLSIHMGWILIVVKLTDRITGNSELGADSARIQVKQGTLEPTFKDIIDMGNNLKSALSRAIKNAQSRFGHGADVYGKREHVRSEEELKRFGEMLQQIRSISSQRAQLFEEQWNDIGVDFSEFLDKWQIYIDRNAPKGSSAEAGRDVRRSPADRETAVTEDNKSQENLASRKTSNASHIADNGKKNVLSF